MNELQSMAVTLAVAKALEAHESWCGETSLQKATYALQELFFQGRGFDFILYKRGPYSFPFRDHLAALRNHGFLDQIQKQPGYGPSNRLTSSGEDFLKRYPKTLSTVAPAIEVVARHFGPKNTAELEQLASALYVSSEAPGWGASQEARAEEIVRLKPHIAPEAALAAVREIELIRKEAATVGQPSYSG